MAKLRAIDLCAGAGGLSLGLQRAGFDVLGVELDADACATHRANVGPCEQASITEWHPSEPADLVGGGVPCQGFSVAGKRGGSDLWREVIRIGQEADARALIIENVRGMLSWRYDDGWGVVARIEEGMRTAGYEPRRALLCAADYGTPQLRYRLIIAAFRDHADLARFSWPLPTHAERPGLFGLRPWVTVREALELGSMAHRSGVVPWSDRTPADGVGGQRMLDVDRPSPTVTAGNSREWLCADGSEPTRLTVEQCALLQGFPCTFEFHGATIDSRDRQMGNAVPVQLGEAVGRSIARALGVTNA